jgi:diguanylate cyclase (GGDEF)-like protein
VSLRSAAPPRPAPPDGGSDAEETDAALLRGVLDHLPHAVIVVDAQWRVVVANARAGALLDRAPGTALGAALWELFPGLSASAVGRCCRLAAADGRAHATDAELPGRPGWFRVHVVPAPGGRLVLHARDVTAEQRLDPAPAGPADRDALTGAANRRALTARLAEAVARARALGPASPEATSGAGRRGAAVLLLDLDGFGAVNAAHGHDAGDRLLRQVAERLGRAARGGDTVARVAADEFAVLLDGVAPGEEAAAGARFLAALAAPFALDAAPDPTAGAGRAPATETAGERAGETARETARGTPRGTAGVTACLGTVAVDGEADADAVLRHAGVALQRARAAGAGRLEPFTPALRTATRAREAVAAALQGALARTLEAERGGAPGDGEFSLAYQPVVDLRTGAPTSVEALLRWRHPALGVVSPATFIPLAEELGLIGVIGAWVLGAACVAVAGLEAPGALAPLAVAVNVSGHQLQGGAFADEVAAALATSGLAPERLTVEVTETALVRDPRRARRVLGELRTTGVRVAIDDFGTGYSSLGYLQQLPLDVLKIDKRFVDGVARGGGPSVAIPRAVIALAGALGLRTVARASRPRRSATRSRRSAAGTARATCSRARSPSPDLAAWLGARTPAAPARGDGTTSGAGEAS